MESRLSRLRDLWRRHSRRTWLLWGLGALVLLGSQALFWEPGLVLLLLDPELLALTATVGVAMTWGAMTHLAGRVRLPPRRR